MPSMLEGEMRTRQLRIIKRRKRGQLLQSMLCRDIIGSSMREEQLWTFLSFEMLAEEIATEMGIATHNIQLQQVSSL